MAYRAFKSAFAFTSRLQIETRLRSDASLGLLVLIKIVRPLYILTAVRLASFDERDLSSCLRVRHGPDLSLRS